VEVIKEIDATITAVRQFMMSPCDADFAKRKANDSVVQNEWSAPVEKKAVVPIRRLP
jgi:hypothetical protein